MKRLVIIAGYEQFGGMVTKENIQTEMGENFSGYWMKETTIETTIQRLKKLKLEEIQKIIKENYDEVYKRLHIKDNCYVVEHIEEESKNHYEEFFKVLDLMEKKLVKEKMESQYHQAKGKENEILHEQIKEKNKRIASLEKELLEIYQSKRWRYTDKILKIFD